MNFHANVLCNLIEIVHKNQGRTYQIFILYFNVLLHGIQDGFDFSFRKKESIFYFQLYNNFIGCLKKFSRNDYI